MGADNTWSGRVTITPPLTWAEVKGSPAVADVRLDLHEDDGPDGVITTAVAVVPTRSSNAWGQGTGDDLQAVIDAHPGHEFAGYLQVDWDPALGGDPAHRYVVRGRRVEKVTPVLVWPGGPNPEIDRLDTENRRLREQVAAWMKSADNDGLTIRQISRERGAAQDRASAAEAEVERLTAELAKYVGWEPTAKEEYDHACGQLAAVHAVVAAFDAGPKLAVNQFLADLKNALAGAPHPRLAQVWSFSGARYDYPDALFATRELAQAAAEIQWCNENDPYGEPVFTWAEDEPGVYEAHIGGMALEWSVRAQPLIWSRDDESES